MNENNLEEGSSDSTVVKTYEETVIEDAKFFVKEFVCYFEDYCHEYYTRLKNGKNKCGKWARRIIEYIETGKGVTEADPEPFSKAAAVVLFNITQKIVESVGAKLNKNEVEKMTKKLYEMRDSPDSVREMLVCTGIDIFQRYERQMEETTLDGDKVRALETLAKDAVHRMINYLKNNPKEQLSVDTLNCGLYCGKSKTKFTVKVGNNELKNSKISDQVGGILHVAWKVQNDPFPVDNTNRYKRVLIESVRKKVEKEILRDLKESTRTDTERLKSIEKKVNEDFLELSQVLDNNFERIEEFFVSIDTKLDEIKELCHTQEKEKDWEWFNVQDPVGKFTGREVELADLHKIIQKNLTTVITGASGIGKTELARRYIQKYGQHYKRVVWMYAKESTALKESFKELAQNYLNMPVTKETNGVSKEIDIKKIVKDVYIRCSTKTVDDKILFVLDDVSNWTEIVDYVPKYRNGPDDVLPHVLITSIKKTAGWNQTKTLHLDVLTIEDAVSLVRRGLDDNFAGKTDNENLLKLYMEIQEKLENSSKEAIDNENSAVGYLRKYEKIAWDITKMQQINNVSVCELMELVKDEIELTTKLSCFPLAIEQSIAHIKYQREHGKTYRIRDFLDDYNKILNSEKFRGVTNSYEKTTYTAYTMTLDKIKQDESECKGKALEILNVIGYVSSNSIPRCIFDDGKKNHDEALFLLSEYSLVKMCDEDFLSIHRLFQDVIRLEIKRVEGKEENVLRKALQMIKNTAEISYTHVTSIWSFVASEINTYKSLIDDFVDSVHLEQMSTPLILSFYGYDESLRLIVEHLKTKNQIKLPSLIRIRDKLIFIPLLKVILGGHLNVDKMDSAPVHLRQTTTPLHFLSFHGYDEAVRLIVEHLKETNPEKLQRLLKTKDILRFIPLLQAVLGGHLNIVKTLLENDDSVQDETLNMSLHVAGSYGHVDIVEYLIEEKGIKLDVQYVIDDNNQKSLPFHLAVFCYGHLEVVKYLLDQDRSVLTMTTEKGENCLHLSAATGQPHLFKYLVEKLNLKHMLKSRAEEYLTPLHYAARNERMWIIPYLINRRLVDHEDIINCLYVAAFYGHLNLFKFLLHRLKCSAEFSYEVDENGWCALTRRQVKYGKIVRNADHKIYCLFDKDRFQRYLDKLRNEHLEFDKKSFVDIFEDSVTSSPFIMHLLCKMNRHQ